ncbi:hypothetical protein ADUPG1_000553, partial [Aduncisulcus paluster]
MSQMMMMQSGYPSQQVVTPVKKEDDACCHNSCCQCICCCKCGREEWGSCCICKFILKVAIWLVIFVGILAGIVAIYDFGYLCKQDDLIKSNYVDFVQSDGVSAFTHMYDGTTDIALLDQTAGDIFIRSYQMDATAGSQYAKEQT